MGGSQGSGPSARLASRGGSNDLSVQLRHLGADRFEGEPPHESVPGCDGQRIIRPLVGTDHRLRQRRSIPRGEEPRIVAKRIGGDGEVADNDGNVHGVDDPGQECDGDIHHPVSLRIRDVRVINAARAVLMDDPGSFTIASGSTRRPWDSNVVGLAVGLVLFPMFLGFAGREEILGGH